MENSRRSPTRRFEVGLHTRTPLVVGGLWRGADLPNESSALPIVPPKRWPGTRTCRAVCFDWKLQKSAALLVDTCADQHIHTKSRQVNDITKKANDRALHPTSFSKNFIRTEIVNPISAFIKLNYEKYGIACGRITMILCYSHIAIDKSTLIV